MINIKTYTQQNRDGRGMAQRCLQLPKAMSCKRASEKRKRKVREHSVVRSKESSATRGRDMLVIFNFS